MSFAGWLTARSGVFLSSSGSPQSPGAGCFPCTADGTPGKPGGGHLGRRWLLWLWRCCRRSLPVPPDAGRASLGLALSCVLRSCGPVVGVAAAVNLPSKVLVTSPRRAEAASGRGVTVSRRPHSSQREFMEWAREWADGGFTLLLTGMCVLRSHTV